MLSVSNNNSKVTIIKYNWNFFFLVFLTVLLISSGVYIYEEGHRVPNLSILLCGSLFFFFFSDMISNILFDLSKNLNLFWVYLISNKKLSLIHFIFNDLSYYFYALLVNYSNILLKRSHLKMSPLKSSLIKLNNKYFNFINFFLLNYLTSSIISEIIITKFRNTKYLKLNFFFIKKILKKCISKLIIETEKKQISSFSMPIINLLLKKKIT